MKKFLLKKEVLLLIVIIFIGTFLRFYKISENFTFDGEIGDNLLDIKNAFTAHSIPLIGPPTSHPWLYFGPLFYWLYGPILALFKFNPLTYTFFGTILSLLILPLNFFFVKKLFGKTGAIISTFFIAISPLFLSLARQSRFFSLVPILIYPFLYFLYKISQGKKQFLYPLCFTFGLMLNFHYSPLILIPFIFSILLVKKIYFSLKQILLSIVVFLLPLFPILIYDAKQKFRMLFSLTLWIPYRILGFLGLYHKNSPSPQALKEDVFSLHDYLSSFINPLFSHAISYIFLAVIAFFVFYLYRKHKIRFEIVFIFLWTVWGIVAVVVHGTPPIHYFVPILSFPIILLSLILSTSWKSGPFGKGAIFAIILGVSLLNVQYLFSPLWFYKYTINRYTYNNQTKVARLIIENAQGKKFVLRRVGSNDQFKGYYAQNYIYLLWLYGNEPVSNASLTYTIYEESETLSKEKYPLAKFFPITPHITVIAQNLSSL